MRQRVSLSLLLLLSLSAHAARPDRSAFLSAKEDIRRLAVERIRSAWSDYERVLVAAENRIRVLHETYQADGGTPPTGMEADLGELRSACQKTQKLMAAGRPPASDPQAQRIIEREWILYRSEIDGVLRQISEKKSERLSESRIYWETLRTFKELQERLAAAILFNTPPGEFSLEDTLSRDEGTLLLACETTPRKTHGTDVRVVAPHEFEGNAKPEIQAFYRSLDQVPDARPLRTGSFIVPPGTRTVTMRDDKARMVFRPKNGKGIAYVGQTESEFKYSYLAVPPDTAYYFENTGPDPLELEFVGVKP
jgi:hypothetical protein